MITYIHNRYTDQHQRRADVIAINDKFVLYRATDELTGKVIIKEYECGDKILRSANQFCSRQYFDSQYSIVR